MNRYFYTRLITFALLCFGLLNPVTSFSQVASSNFYLAEAVPAVNAEDVVVLKNGHLLYRLSNSWLIGVSHAGNLYTFSSEGSPSGATIQIYDIVTKKFLSQVVLPKNMSGLYTTVSATGIMLSMDDNADVFSYSQETKSWTEIVSHNDLEVPVGHKLEKGYNHHFVMSEDGKFLAYTNPCNFSDKDFSESCFSLYGINIVDKRGLQLGKGTPIAWLTGSKLLSYQVNNSNKSEVFTYSLNIADTPKSVLFGDDVFAYASGVLASDFRDGKQYGVYLKPINGASQTKTINLSEQLIPDTLALYIPN